MPAPHELLMPLGAYAFMVTPYCGDLNDVKSTNIPTLTDLMNDGVSVYAYPVRYGGIHRNNETPCEIRRNFTTGYAYLDFNRMLESSTIL